MSMLPPIPGFGVFNKAIPDALGHVAQEAFGAINWVKDQVVKLGTKDEELTSEVAEEAVCDDLQSVPESEAKSDDLLATHLNTSHSIMLAESLQKQEGTDASLDKELISVSARKNEEPLEVKSVTKEKEEIASSTSQTSKAHKRKASGSHHRHHHHHHHSRSRKNK